MMKTRMKAALLVMGVILLAGCVAQENQQRSAQEDIVLLPSTDDRQYMCVSPVYLSDATKSFHLALGSQDNHVALGALLDQAVQKMFWKETKATATSVAPVVTLGFDGGTGAYRDSTLYVRISLQFQIFKPTGQSYLDVAVGESSSQSAENDSDAAVVNAALKQSLSRLAGVLISAGICRPMQ